MSNHNLSKKKTATLADKNKEASFGNNAQP